MDRNLHFWQARLKQGSHLRFMLFGQGPLSFVKDVVSGVRDKRHKRLLSATDKIERRVSSCWWLLECRHENYLSLGCAVCCRTHMHLSRSDPLQWTGLKAGQFPRGGLLRPLDTHLSNLRSRC